MWVPMCSPDVIHLRLRWAPALFLNESLWLVPFSGPYHLLLGAGEGVRALPP